MHKPGVSPQRIGKLLFGISLGAAIGWATAQQFWVLRRLLKIDVRRSLSEHSNQGAGGSQLLDSQETSTFRRLHTVEAGIERIVYLPKEPHFRTPVLMQHGMWQAAGCWQTWQELLAAWGWESHAYSLPGHGASPVQRPMALCTLDYYLGFLKAEIARLPYRPVLFGQDTGGALAQWYLKFIADDLPAAVLVAPWVSRAGLADNLQRFFQLDPVGCIRMLCHWDARGFVRSPQIAAKALLREQSIRSPEELYAGLGPESGLVMYQHNPPFWRPPEEVQTPLLWLAAEQDALFSEQAERHAALHYKADYVIVKRAAHNLMLEPGYRQIASYIHEWLSNQGIE